MSGDDTNKNSDRGLGAERFVSKIVYALVRGVRLIKNNRLKRLQRVIDCGIFIIQLDEFSALKVTNPRLEEKVSWETDASLASHERV